MNGPMAVFFVLLITHFTPKSNKLMMNQQNFPPV